MKKQFGFRKNHSTSHAINYSINHINNSLKNKELVLGIFIDLSKAFDTIDHQILLLKLETYGIRANAHSLITSYLSCRKQCPRRKFRTSIWSTTGELPWSSVILDLHK